MCSAAMTKIAQLDKKLRIKIADACKQEDEYTTLSERLNVTKQFLAFSRITTGHVGLRIS